MEGGIADDAAAFGSPFLFQVLMQPPFLLGLPPPTAPAKPRYSDVK
jgi:hypothetical protein